MLISLLFNELSRFLTMLSEPMMMTPVFNSMQQQQLCGNFTIMYRTRTMKNRRSSFFQVFLFGARIADYSNQLPNCPFYLSRRLLEDSGNFSRCNTRTTTQDAFDPPSTIIPNADDSRILTPSPRVRKARGGNFVGRFS